VVTPGPVLNYGPAARQIETAGNAGKSSAIVFHAAGVL
jgi:hypothetical protein